MTLPEIYTMLTSITGFSDRVAFDEYPKTMEQSLPYINLQTPSTETFGADNIVYFQSPNVNIEFYSRRKDMASESLIEAKLTEYGLYYTKSEVRIDAQSCYEVIYEIGA